MSSAPEPAVHALTARDVVFLTGATGFLGAELARRLVARGTTLHVLARDPAAQVPGAALHVGDLTDAAAIERAVAAAARAARTAGGRLYVLHCGALISYKTRERERSERINVDGTRHVLAAARAQAATRFLFVSSVVAVGSSPDGSTLDERADFDLAPLGVHYADTKRAAEELVLAARSELDVVVVNPGAIFGPALGRSNTVKFLQQVAAGRAPLAAPPGSVSVLGIGDAAEGTLLALERGRSGERYILVESWLRTRDLFRLIAELLGARAPRLVVPRWSFALLVPLARLWDALAPLELAPPQALRMLACDLRLSGDKARRELGWRPLPFRAVLQETIAVLRARGDLPPA